MAGSTRTARKRRGSCLPPKCTYRASMYRLRTANSFADCLRTCRGRRRGRAVPCMTVPCSSRLSPYRPYRQNRLGLVQWSTRWRCSWIPAPRSSPLPTRASSRQKSRRSPSGPAPHRRHQSQTHEMRPAPGRGRLNDRASLRQSCRRPLIDVNDFCPPASAGRVRRDANSARRCSPRVRAHGALAVGTAFEHLSGRALGVGVGQAPHRAGSAACRVADKDGTGVDE